MCIFTFTIPSNHPITISFKPSVESLFTNHSEYILFRLVYRARARIHKILYRLRNVNELLSHISLKLTSSITFIFLSEKKKKNPLKSPKEILYTSTDRIISLIAVRCASFREYPVFSMKMQMPRTRESIIDPTIFRESSIYTYIRALKMRSEKLSPGRFFRERRRQKGISRGKPSGWKTRSGEGHLFLCAQPIYEVGSCCFSEQVRVCGMRCSPSFLFCPFANWIIMGGKCKWWRSRVSPFLMYFVFSLKSLGLTFGNCLQWIINCSLVFPFEVNWNTHMLNDAFYFMDQ